MFEVWVWNYDMCSPCEFWAFATLDLAGSMTHNYGVSMLAFLMTAGAPFVNNDSPIFHRIPHKCVFFD
jgi:hypothetical protein